MIDNLSADIEVLSRYHYYELNALGQNDELQQAYQRFVDHVNNTDNLNDIIDILNDQYHPTDIKIGTIGAGLFGCLYNYYGDISKSCSAICLNSPLNIGTCNKQIWQQYLTDVDLRFVRQYNAQWQLLDNLTPQAYIFVQESFKYFTLTEKQHFAKHNIKQAQILITRHGKHQKLTRMLPLDQLPDSENIKYTNSNDWEFSVVDDTNLDKNTDNNSNNNHIIFTILVILIIIIIIGCIIYK